MIIYDLVVVVGEYEKDGAVKKKYKNVGAVHKGQNGPFIILDRTFNPAGVGNTTNDGSAIYVNCFEKRQDQPKSQNQQNTDFPGDAAQDDDIPF